MLLHPEFFYDYSVEQIHREDARAFESAFLNILTLSFGPWITKLDDECSFY